MIPLITTPIIAFRVELSLLLLLGSEGTGGLEVGGVGEGRQRPAAADQLLEVVGEMPYSPRKIALVEAIELGKQRRPFLKQARANVLNQIEQVHVALGGFLPTINTTGGGEWVSSPLNSSWHDISKGWIAQVAGSWPMSCSSNENRTSGLSNMDGS